jgi:hypothetical protein
MAEQTFLRFDDTSDVLLDNAADLAEYHDAATRECGSILGLMPSRAMGFSPGACAPTERA